MMATRTCRTAPASGPFIGFDRLLGDLFVDHRSPASPHTGSHRAPAVNSWEDEKSYTVELEVPGHGTNDLEIRVDSNVLEVSGGRDEETHEGATWHLRERSVGRFARKLRFPKDVDGTGIEARVADGVLTVTLPKAETARPRKIEVKG